MAEFNFPEWLMAPEPPTPEVPPEYAEADAVREQQLNDQYLAGQRQILNQGENAYYRQQGEAVRFALDPQDWHGHGGEFLWASPLSVSQGDEFEIRNYPCFTRGIGFKDVVKASPSGDRRVFEFQGVIKRSGHSTYMLLVEPDAPKFQAYWKLLEERGCSYETGPIDLSTGRRDLYSIDVPPSADMREVHRILENGESDGAWEFQDGYVHLTEK